MRLNELSHLELAGLLAVLSASSFSAAVLGFERVFCPALTRLINEVAARGHGRNTVADLFDGVPASAINEAPEDFAALLNEMGRQLKGHGFHAAATVLHGAGDQLMNRAGCRPGVH